MKKFVLIIAVCLAAFTATAQTAREVLDATAARMNVKGAVRANFRATQFKGTKPQSDTSGMIIMQGRKFKMRTDDLTVWFDGKQQWSVMKGSNEVNLTEPTDAELAQTNPAALIGIYKQGYTTTLNEGTLRGKPTYIVTLVAADRSAAFQKIMLDIERDTYTPLCIRAKQNGDWLRLAILTFQTDNGVGKTDFTFPKKLYPKAEIIDLR